MEKESKMQEKQELPQNVWLNQLNRLDPETRELVEKEAKLAGKDPEQLLKEKAAAYLEELKAKDAKPKTESPKVSTEEIRAAIQKLQNLETCTNCPNNPEAIEPLHKLVNIDIPLEAQKALRAPFKGHDLKEACLLCLYIPSLLKMPIKDQLEWLELNSHNPRSKNN